MLVFCFVLTTFRCINFYNGDALFATEDPHSDDLLPIDDDLWDQDVCAIYNCYF